jgi:hypothetical protein
MANSCLAYRFLRVAPPKNEITEVAHNGTKDSEAVVD